MMYVYQFMPSEYAIDDLRRRRLKVSLLEDMNDPFELLGNTLDTTAHRRAFRQWKQHMNRICRVLCFSRSWSNPVLWSHYADKHKGICLCFKVPDNLLLGISYEAKRLELQLEKNLAKDGTVGSEISDKLLTTKFADWQYEDEVRLFVKPEEIHEDNGLQFYGFDEHLSLDKVILGPRCKVPKAEVQAAIQEADKPVLVVQSRLAFKSFRVIPVPNQK